MLIQILEPGDYSPSAISTYTKLGELILGPCSEPQKPAIDILVVRLAHTLNAQLLQAYTGLKAIASPTTGLTHIDLAYCAIQGIQVHSLQQHQDRIGAISSTAELGFGLLLALLRNIPAAHQDVIRQHRWQRDRFKSRQLGGMTLGLLGLGRIGTHMAQYARAFGMQIIAHDSAVGDEHFARHSVRRVELDQLCREADIISLHANERDDNYHLIGAAQIALMKNSALIINTARGSLLDEEAAVLALQQQRIAGLACDVLEQEMHAEFPACSALVQAAGQGLNLILTPHIGGCTQDAMHITEEILADHLYQTLGPQHG